MGATGELILFFAHLYSMPPLSAAQELLEGGVVREKRFRKKRKKRK